MICVQKNGTSTGVLISCFLIMLILLIGLIIALVVYFQLRNDCQVSAETSRITIERYRDTIRVLQDYIPELEEFIVYQSDTMRILEARNIALQEIIDIIERSLPGSIEEILILINEQNREIEESQRIINEQSQVIEGLQRRLATGR